MSLGKIGRTLISPISLVIGDKATMAILSIAAAIPGPHQPFAAAAAAAYGTIVRLDAPKPVARGSATNVLIDTEPPRPYMVGESYSAGIMRHRVGYGPTIKKVPNPYLWEVKVFSGVGPVEGLVQEQFDYKPIGSYYNGFYASDVRLGARPDTALVPQLYGPAPGWGGPYHLSGCAAIGSNYKFDKDGKVFASGTPLHGAIWKGEKVYDPRLDSTFPGGSGACRLGVETTYVYSANPALHVGTYAYGRFQNSKKLFGMGVESEGIDWPAIVDWANLCDANGWECAGTLYEGGRGANLQEQRLRNLDDLCAAGGGRWLIAGAVLSFDWHRPRVSLATITDDDLLEEGGSTTAVQSIRERMNGVRPQYISPLHNWEQITADEIVGSTYRAEDGQPLTQTWALNLVKDAAQAGELASYALVDSREIGPIEMNLKAKWRFYRPGETVTVNSTLLGYNGQAVIMQRGLDPATFTVPMTLKSETPAKHDFALGRVANPPPTPLLAQTQEERDLLITAAQAPRGEDIADLVAPANANRVPFSRFEGDRGWASFGDVTGTVEPAVAAGRDFIQTEIAFTAPGQTTFLLNSPRIRVVQNERLSLSARVDAFALSGPAPAFWTLYFEYYNTAGTIIGNVAIASGSGSSPSAVFSPDPLSAFAQVPMGAVSAWLVLAVQSTGPGTMRVAILEPMVASAAPDQTVHPAYTPGPNASDGATVGAPAGTLVAGIEASALVTDLANARNDAERSAIDLANIANDARVTVGEKISVRERRGNIANEFPIWRDRAAAFGVDSGIRTNYQASYDALIVYLAAINIDANTTSTIVRADFVASFNNYAFWREKVIEAISQIAATRATVAGAEAGLVNANIPLGANAVVNSDFTRGKFGWRWRDGIFETDWGVNLAGSPANWFGQRNVMWATYPGTLAINSEHDLSPNAIWGGAGLANAPLFALPVVAGDRLAASVLAAPHRCSFQLFILIFDGAGTLVSAQVVGGGTQGGAANGDPANFTRLSLFSDVPATGRWAIPMMRMLGTGEAEPFIFFTEPMLSKIAAGQTVAPRYSPGRTDPNADATLQQPVVSKLNPITGRVADPTAYNTQAILGPRNVSLLVPNYTINASNVTVNLPAHSRIIAGPSGPITLNYGAASGVVAFSTYWTAYIDDPDLIGLASPTVVFTSQPTDLLFPGRYQISSGYSPSASGTGGSSGGGGGGAGVPPRLPGDPVLP